MRDIDIANVPNEKEDYLCDGDLLGTEYEISVKNMNSNGKVRLLVYPENTLNQVLEATYMDLGLDSNPKNNLFINENNETNFDGNTTLIGFGVKENNLLRIAPYAHGIA